MLHLIDLRKEFADRVLFDRLQLHIRPGDRIGLCGDNGSGKTTLLKLLAGQLDPDGGRVAVARGTTFGYLPQDGLTHEGRTLFEEVRSGLDELVAIETEMEQIQSRLEENVDEELLERYSELEQEFARRGGYAMEAEIGRVLCGLGFAESDWQRPCETFSGGWQMRIALARLLLRRPNLLLLDEPTNHLDLPARDWLEDYLRNYPYAVVLVSHDRYFLDQVVGRIVELWNGRLTEYPGNYSTYLKQRTERIEALREAKRRQDEEIARIEAFINRFRYQANKASLVQSRIKQLEKIERIELPPQRKSIAFRFPDPPKGGREVMVLEQAAQRYGDLEVFSKVDLTIERGERVALVGANGAGKSTLMRLLAGVEAPAEGRRIEGYNLEMAYFAQDQARVLDPDKTVLQQITEAAPFSMVPRVRDILGSFLFSGDDVDKPVRVLSGGERNRLALAILLLRPANLLLLDEPTNHLDLASKEVLLEALKGYRGTLVFVSHDRHFVDSLATRVVYVANGGIDCWPGNYSDFVMARAARGDESHSELRVEQKSARNQLPDDRQARREEHARRKARQRAEQKRQRELEQLETQIEQAETELGEVETEMALPESYQDAERWKMLSARHQELKDGIEALYRRWEELQLEETA